MYEPGKEAVDYWEEICAGIVHSIGKAYKDVLDAKRVDFNQIQQNYFTKSKSDMINHAIFIVYYIIYLLCAERNSLTYYYRKFFPEVSGYEGDNINIVDNHHYSKSVYDYGVFRSKADDTAKFYYDKQNIGLYNKLTADDFKNGYKITLLDYLIMYRMGQNSNIEVLLKVLRDERLASSKSVSKDKFFEEIVPGIDDLYESILSFNYGGYSKECRDSLLRCVDFYQLEHNCAIEFNYKVAEALSKVKGIKNEQKQNDLKTFQSIRLTSILFNHKQVIIQNKYINPQNDIFCEYIAGNLSAADINEYYNAVNQVIHIGVYSMLSCYFEQYFGSKVTERFYMDIYQNSDKIREMTGITSIDDFMCDETDEFFKSFLGQGQHIKDKNWKDIKLKNLRDLYQGS